MENEPENATPSMWCEVTCLDPTAHQPSYVGVSNTIIIGRSSKADIMLAPTWISGVHATIRRQKVDGRNEMRVTIEDTSTHGTEIDGHELTRGVPYILTSGEHILIGSRHSTNYEFYFRMGREPQLRGIATHQYDAVKLIGEGRYGTVYKAVHKKSGHCCALKVVNPLLCKRDRGIAFQIAMREVRTLCAARNHPGIVQLIEHNFQHPDYYIALELAEFGNLCSVFRDRPPKDSTVGSVFVQLLSAVRYLHSLNLVHRDIKRENVVVVACDPEIVVKLADFGTAVSCANGDIHAPLGGTTSHFSPEAVERCAGQGHLRRSQKLPCGKPCDMWAMGVLFYRLLFGVLPFVGKDEYQLCAAIHAGSLSYPLHARDSAPEGAIDMINSLLRVDQTTRCTVQQALQHSWVTTVLQRMLTSMSPELVRIAELEISQFKKVA